MLSTGLQTFPEPTPYPNGIYAAGFWGSRVDDPWNLASRLRQFLERLGAINPLMAEWYLTVPRKESPKLSVSRSEPELRELIADKAESFRRGAANDEQGAIIALWAGDYSVTAGLTLRLGFESARVGNAVVLKLPAELNHLLLGTKASIDIVEAITSSWDPDRAVLRPDDVLCDDPQEVEPGEVVRPETMWRRYSDWIIYQRGKPLELADPFKGKTL
jgi:hypothetical protein